MKIVIPVDEDKSTIVKRTGRAPFYAIYEDAKLVEFVVNHHAQEHEHEHGDEHEHHEHAHGGENHHRKDIAKLQGCDVILAQAVGEQMQSALESAGIKIQKLSKYDGTTATEVLEKFLAHALKSQSK
jgi:predicted Fe-Mo cluster-binding NifX family protein